MMNDLIKENALKYEINSEMLNSLINLEQEKVHLQRRRNVTKDILEIIDKYIQNK